MYRNKTTYKKLMHQALAGSNLLGFFAGFFPVKRDGAHHLSILSLCYSVLAISTLSVLVVFDVYHCWSNDIAS